MDNAQTEILSEEERILQEKIQNATEQELNDFISEVLELAVPEGHELEQKYADYQEYSEASDALGKEKYPNFYGKQGESLKKEIKSDPIAFKKMIFDYRLLRKNY